MATLMVYKRNSKFIDLSELVEDLSSSGLMDILEKYYTREASQEHSGRTEFPTILEQVISNSNYSWRYYTFRIRKSQ
jgi:hypothetical protein